MAIGSRAEALARDALTHLSSNVPTSEGSRLLRLQGLLSPVIEALEVRITCSSRAGTSSIRSSSLSVES